MSVQQFLIQKQHNLHALPSLFTLSHPKRLSLFPQMKKTLKGKCFADVEVVKQTNKQKMEEALKDIKIDEFKNCFEEWKKCINRCIKWRILSRWLKFKHVRINIQFFINKFQFWGVSLLVGPYSGHSLLPTKSFINKLISLWYFLQFPVYLRNSQFALRSYMDSIYASRKFLGWGGNSTVWLIYEKPTSLLLDRLSTLHSNMLWVQGLKSCWNVIFC